MYTLIILRRKGLLYVSWNNRQGQSVAFGALLTLKVNFKWIGIGIFFGVTMETCKNNQELHKIKMRIRWRYLIVALI